MSGIVDEPEVWVGNGQYYLVKRSDDGIPTALIPIDPPERFVPDD